MDPVARIDYFLAKICGEDYELPEPQTRVELFLANIAGESYELPEPEARIELFLAKILGQDVELPAPQSRIDRYLAAIAGEDVDPPETWTTRTEYWLDQWAQSSGGQIVAVTGISPLLLANSKHNAIKSLTQTGLCTQATTPTPDNPVDIVCNNGVLTKPHDTYTSVDGQGTYVSSSMTRIYKALNVEDGSYTISVPTAYDFIVQYKTPTDGSTPTDSGNITSWVNGSTTVTLDKGTGYGYGIAIRDHVNQSGNISPSDFSGTIVVVHDDEPVKAVGTPEVLTVSSNIYDGSAAVYVTLVGAETDGEIRYNGSSTSLVMPCEANTEYTVYMKSAPSTGTIFRAATCSELASSTNTPVAAIRASHSESGYAPFTISTGAGAKYLYVQVSSSAVAEARNQLVVRKPADTPQTVTDIPMLLSVGDYADDAEIIEGIKTGKVGVLVLDGVTDGKKLGTAWNSTYKRGNLTVVDMLSSAAAVVDALCTHFGYSVSAYSSPVNDSFCTNGGAAYFSFVEEASINSSADANAYLAAQYAAGTPVIIIYPLATETTEQGAAHSLHSYDGATVVDAEANVSPVSLACEYMQASA